MVAVMVLAGCTLAAETKTTCTLSSDCDEGRTCVARICQTNAPLDAAAHDLSEEADASESSDLGVADRTPSLDAAQVDEAMGADAWSRWDAPDFDAAVDAGLDSSGVCGNGTVDPGELCDDGNDRQDDRCRNDCQTAFCGDGVTQPDEDCDDGNNSSNDRCTPSCRWVRFVDIVADEEHFCALRSNGMVTCWGEDLGAPPDVAFDSVAAGGGGSCGVTGNSLALCWGSWSAAPVAQRLQQVALATDFACGLTESQEIACWDRRGTSLAGVPSGQFSSLSAGGVAACAIRELEGTVVCWGDNRAIVDGVPKGKFVQTAVGGAGACAIDASGQYVCWGGVISTNDQIVPAARISIGPKFACRTSEDRSPYCWPSQQSGEHAFGIGFTRLAIKKDTVCGIEGNGTVDCWGHQGAAIPDSPTPRPVRSVVVGPASVCVVRPPDDEAICGEPPFSVGSVLSVAPGLHGVCGIGLDLDVTCWGTPAFDVPEPAAGGFRHLTAGASHWCALDLQDRVSCWGANGLGQTKAPAGAFSAISAVGDHTCGIRPTGEIACWGDEESWRGYPPPTGEFVQISAGSTANCALRKDAPILCWGPGPLASNATPNGLRSVSVWDDVGCGLDPDFQIRCWGDVGRWRFFPRGRFVNVTVGPTSCGVRADGQIVCFGDTVVNADNRIDVGSGP